MQREKVLIVEDDPSARKQLAKFVGKEGFDVIEAEDAKVGFEKIDTEKPDIILTDFKLPGGNGLQIIQHAKKVKPLCQTILITAFGELDTAITALREGVLDYLKKPLDLDALATTLGRAREKVLEHQSLIPFPVLLIVEDDEQTLTNLGRAMAKESWRVLQAKDGEEALKIFSEEKIDLVVLDIKMPGKDGLTVLHEMRQQSADFEAIMVTGYGDEQSVITALHDGAINFIKKPVDLDQLQVFLEKAVAVLNLKRSLRFRKRELELAQGVIARIDTNTGVIMDFLAPEKSISPSFVMHALDSIAMGMIVVNKNSEILYANKCVLTAAEGHGQKLNESFLKTLEKLGIRGLSYEQLTSTLNDMFAKSEGAAETITVGKWAYIALVKFKLTMGETRNEEVVLLATRGERS